MVENKKILDATCGSKMMWFDHNHPDALYIDKRNEQRVFKDGTIVTIVPDEIVDFTNMPYADESFYLVVFDPPHILRLKESTSSIIRFKYGQLFPGWESIIKEGFNECFRVLKTNGILIFKWGEPDVSVEKVLSLLDRQPLFGHTTGKHGKTKWMTFMK
jgi:hypothetical protein